MASVTTLLKKKFVGMDAVVRDNIIDSHNVVAVRAGTVGRVYDVKRSKKTRGYRAFIDTGTDTDPITLQPRMRQFAEDFNNLTFVQPGTRRTDRRTMGVLD